MIFKLMNAFYLYSVFLGLSLYSCINAQSDKTQDTPRNNKVQKENVRPIEFSDNYLIAIISRDSCSSFNLSQSWEYKNGFASIKSFDPVDSIKHQSVPIKFTKHNDNIFLTYINKDNKIDSTIFLSTISNDTIESFEDFRTFISKTESLKEIQSIYTGDTVLFIKNKKYECYKFELFKNWVKSFPGPSRYKTMIYLDKNSLIPIEEDYFVYYTRHFCIPNKKWVLVREIKLNSTL